jgi:uncharacterized protein YdeI (YjbR/CyaY-like superfamily)
VLDGKTVAKVVASLKPAFFKNPAELRSWMRANHASCRELLVGFHKKDSGKPSVTYHEALDEALAVGWIDGIRKSLGPESYTVRFTPRKRGSYWSQVNIARANALIADNRMTDAGRAAFDARDEIRSKKYSFEREASAFEPAQERLFKANKKAWTFFQAQPPGVRKVATFWVVSAKQEETRTRRLATLIDEMAHGRRLNMLKTPKPRA